MSNETVKESNLNSPKVSNYYDELSYKLKVMQACIDGYTIECKDMGSIYSWRLTSNPQWNWDLRSYRIKTEPFVRYVTYCEDTDCVSGIYKNREAADRFVNKIDSNYRVIKLVEELQETS